MKRVLKMEWNKLIRSKGLWISLVLGMMLVLLQFIWIYRNSYRENNQILEYVLTLAPGEIGYGEWYEQGILEGWVGTETKAPYNSIIYLVLPLLAAFPYGLSLCNEWRSGYASQLVTRCGRKKYFAAKYTTTFAGGAIAVAFPLLVDLLCAACIMPAIGSDPLAMQSSVRVRDMWGTLYFERPVLYALGYVVIDAVFGGIYACMTLVCSGWTANRFSAACFPVLVYITLIYGVSSLFPDTGHWNPAYYENPSHFLYSTYCSFEKMVILLLGMLAILIVLYFLQNRRRDAIGRR